MSKPVWALLAALLATALVVAGCGGGSGSESSTEGEGISSLTKAQFLKQGNAICAHGSKEISEAFEEFAKERHLKKDKKPSEAEVVEAMETIVIPGVREQVSEIRALGLPKGGEEEVEAILTAVEAALKKGEENPKLMAEEGEGPFAEANKLAREFGLTKCGEEGE